LSHTGNRLINFFAAEGLGGYINFKFSSCIAIESGEDDGENNQNYSDGDAKKIEQYIVGNFVGSVGKMVVEQVESYCEVCKEAGKLCEDSDFAQNLEPVTYYNSDEDKTVEFIDCNACALYNCDEENNGRLFQEDEEVDMESALEYLEEVSQCQQFQYSYENQEYRNNHNADDYEDDEIESQGSEALLAKIPWQCSI
jgi:hypothetical protein